MDQNHLYECYTNLTTQIVGFHQSIIDYINKNSKPKLDRNIRERVSQLCITLEKKCQKLQKPHKNHKKKT